MATEGIAKVTEENTETKENMEVDEVDESTVAEWVFWNNSWMYIHRFKSYFILFIQAAVRPIPDYLGKRSLSVWVNQSISLLRNTNSKLNRSSVNTDEVS